MRILVVSDSHGSKWKFREVIQAEPSAHHVIFLGDGYRDFEEIEAEYINKKILIAVAGNCDLYCSLPKKITTAIGGKNFYITHGDSENVKFGLNSLMYSALQENCDIALYGHTHTPLYKNCDGVHLFNPGSLRNGDYGVIDITDNGFICINKNLLT